MDDLEIALHGEIVTPSSQDLVVHRHSDGAYHVIAGRYRLATVYWVPGRDHAADAALLAAAPQMLAALKLAADRRIVFHFGTLAAINAAIADAERLPAVGRKIK